MPPKGSSTPRKAITDASNRAIARVKKADQNRVKAANAWDDYRGANKEQRSVARDVRADPGYRLKKGKAPVGRGGR